MKIIRIVLFLIEYIRKSSHDKNKHVVLLFRQARAKCSTVGSRDTILSHGFVMLTGKLPFDSEN